MKKQFLTLGLGALLSMNAFADGGIDGGGGGTLPADPISILEVERIIEGGKKEVRLILNYMSTVHRMGSKEPIWSKMFDGEKTILDLVETVDIEVRKDKACLATTGIEVDGSILGNRPNTICISSYRIAPKLIEERAKTEIYALIAHELSHLLGASEAEAREFQKDVAYYTKNADLKDSQNSFAKMYHDSQGINAKIQSFKDMSLSADDLKLSRAADTLNQEVLNYADKLNNFEARLSYFDGRRNDYFDIKRAELRLAFLWAKALTEQFNAYDYLFKDKDQITYCEVVGGSCYNEFGSMPIARIKSREDLNRQMQKLARFFSDLTEQVIAVAAGEPVPQFDHEPWVGQNPWRNFLGNKFVVTDAACVENNIPINTSMRIQSIDIVEDNGRLMFKENWSSGYSHFTLENGDHENYGTVYIEGSAAAPVKRSIQGDLWARYHQIRTVELKEKSGSFQLVVQRDQKQQDSYAGPSYHSLKCVYSLTKN